MKKTRHLEEKICNKLRRVWWFQLESEIVSPDTCLGAQYSSASCNLLSSGLPVSSFPFFVTDYLLECLSLLKSSQESFFCLFVCLFVCLFLFVVDFVIH